MTTGSASQQKRGSAAHRILTTFLALLVIFVVLNLLAAHLMSDCGLPAVLRMDACNDDTTRLGWPMKFYEEGGIAFHSFFSASTLGGDIVAGVVRSLALAFGSQRL